MDKIINNNNIKENKIDFIEDKNNLDNEKNNSEVNLLNNNSKEINFFELSDDNKSNKSNEAKKNSNEEINNNSNINNINNPIEKENSENNKINNNNINSNINNSFSNDEKTNNNNSLNKNENNLNKYKLKAIAIHNGTSDVGHYYTYIKIDINNNNSWYESLIQN